MRASTSTGARGGQVGVARQSRPVRDHRAALVDAHPASASSTSERPRVRAGAGCEAQVAHQGLRVQVAAPLQHGGADGRERFRPVADERPQVAAARQLVARRQRVRVERLAVDLDAALLQRRLERLHEEERRIRDRGGSDQGRGSLRDPSADHQRGLVRAAAAGGWRPSRSPRRVTTSLRRPRPDPPWRNCTLAARAAAEPA